MCLQQGTSFVRWNMTTNSYNSVPVDCTTGILKVPCSLHIGRTGTHSMMFKTFRNPFPSRAGMFADVSIPTEECPNAVTRSCVSIKYNKNVGAFILDWSLSLSGLYTRSPLLSITSNQVLLQPTAVTKFKCGIQCMGKFFARNLRIVSAWHQANLRNAFCKVSPWTGPTPPALAPP